jgi:hypothetical protein
MGKQQVQTHNVSISYIMKSAAFRKGVEERRASRPPSFDLYDIGPEHRGDLDGWSYERGRLWATLAPPDMPLRIGGKLNPKAVDFYELFSRRKLIT